MAHRYRFLATPEKNKKIWHILDDERHHLKKVLRLKETEEVEVFDGNGLDAIGTITKITASEVIA